MIEPLYDSYLPIIRRAGGTAVPVRVTPPDWRLPKEALAQFRPGEPAIEPVDHYMNDVVIHGCPERVVDELLTLEEQVPLGYLLLSPLSEKTFGLFTDRVLPHVAG